jgi:hypothetical protein
MSTGDNSGSVAMILFVTDCHDPCWNVDHADNRPYLTLPVENYLHCRRVLQTIQDHGSRFHEIRVDVQNQQTLLAALDVDLLADIIVDGAMIQVMTSVADHYLVHHLGTLLQQKKRTTAREHRRRRPSQVFPIVLPVPLVYVLQCIRTYVPCASRIGDRLVSFYYPGSAKYIQ